MLLPSATSTTGQASSGCAGHTQARYGAAQHTGQLFQASDSSVGATATSGLMVIRKSRHGAKVHKFWLGKTSRLGNLDIWEPPSVPSQGSSQEGGRTRIVRTPRRHQGCIYFQLCLYPEGKAHYVV